MAEAVLFDFVGNIVANLASQAIQEIGLASNVGNDVEKLKNKLSAIKVVLLDAEEQQANNDAVKDWLRRLKDAVYDADDVVDEFETEALRRQVEIHGSRSKEVKNFFSRSNPLAFRHKMGHRIKEMRKNLEVIASDMSRFHFRERLHDTRPIANIERKETHSFIRKSTVIGREEDKKKIVEILLKGPPDSNLGGDDGVHHHHHYPADQNVAIIPIVGIGGLGKTTLAQLAYNDQSVADHFHLRMWVCVSDEFDVKLLTQKIIRCANPSDIDCSNKEMEQLQASLRKAVDGRRYLLVLDDVWNEDQEKWDYLKNLLMGGSLGSKILVTTRIQKVATIMGSVETYRLQGLSDDECWELFRRRAFQAGEEQRHPKLVEIGREIVRKCRGVPLAARTLGSLMRLKRKESEWLFVKDNEIWRIEKEAIDGGAKGNKILPSLRLSYDYLPSKLKQCFAYCAIFPKDQEIEKETLIQLWMAQGFIGSYQGSSSSSERSLEEIGEEYFNDLLWRCMFQEAKEDEEGNIVSCKMHDLVHDLAQSVAGVECFRVEVGVKGAQPPTIPEGVRHVTLLKNLSQLKLPNKVRTLVHLSHDYYFGRFPIERLMSLRVLDLHEKTVESLQISSIGELKHLRYLDLSYNPHIGTLPTSITKLQNLQTMKLTNCGLEKLPEDIGNMKSLRLVDLSWNCSINALPASITKLENLHTLDLAGSSLEKLSVDILGLLTRLSRIKGLGLCGEHIKLLHALNQQLSGHLIIRGVEQVRDGKKANLKEKPHLRSLTLEYGGEGDNDDDALEGLQPHPNLKELYVSGYGGMKFASWMIESSLLPNLVTIALQNCPRCESLEFSGPLPSLEYLSLCGLEALKSITSKLRKGDGFFPSLKYLYLRDMPKLESWSVVMEILDGDQEVVVVEEEEEPHNSLSLFPHLPNRWIIKGCPKLESIWGLHVEEWNYLELMQRHWSKKKTKQDKTPIPLILTSSSSSTTNSSSSSSSSFQHFLRR
uniref:Disease resistance protein RGA3 n=1 Tax=Nelumbo nucifera TaxID=4432 RepID=A0A822YC04_NELNU|nr:TPA_asm: hypothetical protein HUJ06_031300 [Nelumbo nucifera]